MVKWRYPAAGIIAAILAVVALFPATASASTAGFSIWNNSSHTLVLTGSCCLGGVDGPDPGAVLQPGEGPVHFEIPWLFGTGAQQALTFGYGTDKNNAVPAVSFELVVGRGGDASLSCSTPAGSGACSESTPIGDTSVNGYFLDAPHTVINLPADQPQPRADALGAFCGTADHARAVCIFNPTSEQQILGPQHQVGPALVNDTTTPQNASVEVSDTVGVTDSLDVGDSSWQMFTSAGAAVSAMYGRTWTTSHTFDTHVDVSCPAGMMCAVHAVDPMIRDAGDFAMHLGNTRYNVPGVYFDSPDPNRGETVTVTATPNKTLTLRPGKWRPPKVLRGTYRAPKSVETRSIAEPKLRLAIAGPRTVVPGHKASYRLTLRRSQPVGRYAYALQRVRVATTVAGHAVGHFLVRSLPPFKARTLRLTVRVPSTRRGMFCISADASARHAHGTRARECADLAAHTG